MGRMPDDPGRGALGRTGLRAPGAPGRGSLVRRALLVALAGAGAGLLSGLFGVGGGLVIVPVLMSVLGMDQRRASATSLVAIILTAAAGCVSYGLDGEVSLLAALVLAAGSLVGAQIGVRLLRALPDRILPWIFVAFALFVIIAQQMKVPVRDAALVLDPPRALGLIGVGLLSGILSGLVGVGGGGVIVPGLELVVGVGDLLARGTSLLVMIPTAISGTWTNARHGIVDIKAGLVVGAFAALLTPLGRLVARAISPGTGNILFALFLLVMSATMLMRARRRGN